MLYKIEYNLHHKHHKKNVHLDDPHDVIALMRELRAEGAVYVSFEKIIPAQRKGRK